MARKKRKQPERIMFARRLPLELVERFQRYVDSLIPRTTDTAVLEMILAEYLDQHETQTKKEEPE